MKLSLLTKELKALRCDLLTLTPSAVAAFPNGLYLGNSKVWNGTPELRKVFKKVKIDKILTLEHYPQQSPICIGQYFSTAIYMGMDSVGIKEVLNENAYVTIKPALLNVYLLDGRNKIPIDTIMSAKKRFIKQGRWL